jgi:hypothetical protein
VSKIKIGAKQLALRPSLLLDVVRKVGLKALWLPDRKRILIDQDIPDLKKRHAEVHEILHSITPHHQRFLFGDDSQTLNRSCYEKLEAEANYGAGQLLFLQNRFVEEARGLPQEMKSVRMLSEKFGNTITMTLWRLIEEAHNDHCIFGIISAHPVHLGKGFDRSSPCRYFIESPAFRAQFGNVSESTGFRAIQSYATSARGGSLGQGVVRLEGRDGGIHKFHMETFFNGHDALTLGRYLKPTACIVGV